MYLLFIEHRLYGSLYSEWLTCLIILLNPPDRSVMCGVYYCPCYISEAAEAQSVSGRAGIPAMAP